MVNLSKTEARTLTLHHQYLSRTPTPRGQQGALEVIEQLGYLQIDTISVVSRAHHHILQSRVTKYQESHLAKLEAERHIFEYWAHAASYLPMKDYRFSLARKEAFARDKGHWFKKDTKMMAFVLDRIQQEGPLMSKDFEKLLKPDLRKTQKDWATNPVKQALHELFMEGKLMITGRKGFQKIYDITERVIPNHIDTSVPSRKEYLQYIIERDVQAHALIKAREIGHLLKGTKKEINELLVEMTHSGQLLEITIEGEGGYYTKPEYLENLSSVKRKRSLWILSPFDNLVIHRKRLEELWDFQYTLECYVPAAKRKVGYFSLPLLMGTKFIGQIDLKADRKKKVLRIKNLVWEKKVKTPEKYMPTLLKRLNEFAVFNQCERVEEYQ